MTLPNANGCAAALVAALVLVASRGEAQSVVQYVAPPAGSASQLEAIEREAGFLGLTVQPVAERAQSTPSEVAWIVWVEPAAEAAVRALHLASRTERSAPLPSAIESTEPRVLGLIVASLISNAPPPPPARAAERPSRNAAERADALSAPSRRVARARGAIVAAVPPAPPEESAAPARGAVQIDAGGGLVSSSHIPGPPTGTPALEVSLAYMVSRLFRLELAVGGEVAAFEYWLLYGRGSIGIELEVGPGTFGIGVGVGYHANHLGSGPGLEAHAGYTFAVSTSLRMGPRVSGRWYVFDRGADTGAGGGGTLGLHTEIAL